RDSPAGVVLAARSGAGKTIACRKAFLDCLTRPGRPSPPLAGWLPCWVGLGVPLPEVSRLRQLMIQAQTPEEQQHVKDRQGDLLQDGGVIEGLIGPAAELDGPAPSPRFRQWLRHGPPLLLFIDLNAAAPLDREVIAQGLGAFMADHGFR